MKEIRGDKKITVTTICSVVFLIAVLLVSSTLFNFTIPTGATNAYMEDDGNFQSNIMIEGVKLRVYQNTGEGYKNVTKVGFDQIYQYFATDKTYNYDLIIKNDEDATVSADQYYLRWYFSASVDGVNYDITDFCNVDTAFVYKQNDSDGKTRFYSVNSGASNVIGVQNQLTFLSSISFDGEYDATTKVYASVLDKEFSGSKVKITAHIEGSLTPYEIIYSERKNL